MCNQGRPVAHKKVLSAIWGTEFKDHIEYLRTYVRELRKRIEDDSANPQYLLTAPYVGYRFRE
jgi:two-component system KDP operon response regulator KdpE